MANQPESPTYDAGVYQIEATDPVDGGVGAVTNKPLLNLADRTAYLKQHVDNLENGTTQPPGMAPLNSPNFTGSPTAPTQAFGDASTKLANDAFVQGTVNGVSTINVAGGANVTLTAAQAGQGTLVFTGAITANIAVIVPNTAAKWEVSNQTTGAFTLTVKTAAGTGIVVTQGKNTSLWCDTTNVNDGKTDFISPAFTGSPTAPTAASGDNSNLVSDTAFVFNAADGMASVNVAGNTDVTLTQAQYGCAILNLTGALTGNINLKFPQQTGQWIVANNSTGAFAITGKTTASGTPATVTLPQGSAVLIYGDGTNLALASSAGNQASLTRTSFAPTAGTKTLTVPTGYTPGNVLLEKNGALLEPADFAQAIPAPTQNAASTAVSGGSLASGTYYYEVTALTSAGETTASNEVSIATSHLAVPAANTPTTSTTGGTLGAATYYYVVTALGSSGETTKSNEVSITTTGTTSSNTVTWGAVAGATGYRIYRGTAAGAESVYYSVGAVTTFTDTGAANTSGTPPASNTAVSSTNANTVNWTAVTNATGYRVYRGTASGSENVYYAPGNVTSYTDTGAASTSGTPPTVNTAADGSTITLTTATVTNDSFNLYAFKTFTVANAVQKSGDTMAGPLALFGGDTIATDPAASDSSGKIPSTRWVGSNTPGRLLNVQVVTGSTTYNKTAGTNSQIVEAVGGGGGGGGCVTNGCGGGGGAGAFARVYIPSAVTGVTVTIGAAGTAGAAGSNNGGNGGTTSFGSLISCPGGGGGSGGASVGASTAVFTAGGNPSAAPTISGATNLGSAIGRTGFYGLSGQNGLAGGAGAESKFGSGGQQTFAAGAATQAGIAGSASGSGGSGAASGNSGSSAAGGAGAAGIVYVFEYA
jgi:hypothetical protein